MKIHKIQIDYTEAYGKLGIAKQYVKLGSIPQGTIISIENQITVILGANGSGKSTLISGLEGRGRKKILPIQDDPTYNETQMLKVFDKDGKEIDNLKAYGNITRQKPLYHEKMIPDQFVEPIDFNAETLHHTKFGHVSSGEYTLAQINQLIVKAQKEDIVLLFDEPDTNLDLENKNRLLHQLTELINTGVQLFLVTHDILLILALQRVVNQEIGVIEFTDRDTPLQTTSIDLYLDKVLAGGNEYLRPLQLNS